MIRTATADKGKKSARGRPRKGKEPAQVTSIRLEPGQKKLIKKLFGSVQLWIDHCLIILEVTNDKSRNHASADIAERKASKE